MAAVLRPITRRTNDLSVFASRLKLGALSKSQEYDCRNGGSTDPDPIVTRVPVPPYITFHYDGAPLLGGATTQRPVDDLKKKFYERVVQRTAAAYQAALNANIGVFEMTIPFDSIVFPTYKRYHVDLVSEADYVHFRATWAGMNLREWVVVSMPVGDRHTLYERGTCTATGYTPVLPLGPSAQPVRFGGRSYPPKTRFGRQLTAMQKKMRKQSLEDRIKQLQEELEKVRAEIAELEGQ